MKAAASIDLDWHPRRNPFSCFGCIFGFFAEVFFYISLFLRVRGREEGGFLQIPSMIGWPQQHRSIHPSIRPSSVVVVVVATPSITFQTVPKGEKGLHDVFFPLVANKEEGRILLLSMARPKKLCVKSGTKVTPFWRRGASLCPCDKVSEKLPSIWAKVAALKKKEKERLFWEDENEKRVSGNERVNETPIPLPPPHLGNPITFSLFPFPLRSIE